MKFGPIEIPPKTKETKKEEPAQIVSDDEESIWRMFREDKYEKVPETEEKSENLIQEDSKKESKHVPSQEVINIAGGLEIDSEMIINEALDENGNIKNMSKIFIGYFEEKVKNKLSEKYTEESLNDICFDNWFWREREFIDELVKKLLNKEIKNDIDKAIVLKSILDFSTDQINGPDEATWVSFGTIESFIKEFKSQDISILEKALLKKAIYDLNDIYSIDSINPEADLNNIKQKIGSLKRVDSFNDKLFDHSKLRFAKEQKDLIVSDNNNIDRSEFLGEEWRKYSFANVEEVIKNEQEEFLTDFVVSKLSPNTVGVYSLKGRLIGWQKIENLETEGEDGIIKDFFEIKKECPMNSKEDLALFKISSSLYFRDFIQQELNIDLSKLSIENQFYFLNFIQGKTEIELSEFKEFVEKSKNEEEKINKLRTFLSIEQGGKEMGDKIIGLGEKLPADVAKSVFAKYGEVVDVADNIENTLKEILPENIVDESQNEIKEIKESLFVRAKDLLVTFYDKKEKNDTDLINDLDRYKAEILLYADTYKKLKESGKDVTLEDIKNTHITILSQEEKEKMANNFWNITKANRPFIIEGSEEMTNREKNFNLTIENKDSDFYVLKYKDNVIAFCSFTPDSNGDLYIESLNTESEAKGSHIGSEFLPSVLEKAKKLGRDIYGHVHARNSGTLPYYERLGFDIKPIEDNGELKYYEIRIKAQQKQEQVSMAA